MNITVVLTLLLALLCKGDPQVEDVNEVSRRLLTTYQYPLNVQQLSGSCEDTEYEFARLYADAIGICTLSVAKITPPAYCRKATFSTSTSCMEETPGLMTRYVDSCCVTESVCLEEILNQWLGLFSGLVDMFSWGFDDFLPQAPNFAAEMTVTVIEGAINQGLSLAEAIAESSEAVVMKPFAQSKLAFKNVMSFHENEDLLMEVAQGYLDRGLATGEAYEHWNVYPAVTRETILATACRQVAGNALRADESHEKLRRSYQEAAESLDEHEPLFDFNVPDCLQLPNDASHARKVACAKQVMDTIGLVDPTGVSTIVNAFTYETCPSISDPNEPAYNPRTYLRQDHPWHSIKGELRNQLLGVWNTPGAVNDRGDGDSIFTQLKAAMLPQACVQFVKGVCRVQNNYYELGSAAFPTRSLVAMGTSIRDYCCPVGFKEIETESECREAHDELEIAHTEYGGSVNSNTRAFGCLLDVETETVQFNSNRNPAQAMGMDETLCVRGVGQKGEGFAVAREIRGYRMGREGRNCPERTHVLFESDCQYALRQFTDSENVPMDRLSNDRNQPAGCSYNVETHRGQWNVVNAYNSHGSGSTDVEPICYNLDDVTITLKAAHCNIHYRKMWDDWCCAFGIDYCPSDYTEIGVVPSEDNTWYNHRYYRLCYKEVCECPSNTREYTVQVQDGSSSKCVSGAYFGNSNSGNCYTEGHDSVSRDAQCPGDMYCDVDTQQCEHPQPLNFVHSTPAFDTSRGGMCTCPNGQVYAAGTSRDGELACHGGVPSEITDASNQGWSQGNVVCASCQGSEISAACGKVSDGMGMYYQGQEAWLGVPNGEANTQYASAEYKFHCSEDVNDFSVRARVYAPSGRDNSFWFWIDRQRRQAWHFGISQDFQVANSPSNSISAGTHSFWLRKREDGAFLSTLIMNNDVCEWAIDNTQHGDRQEFAFVANFGCGGSVIESDWTMDADYYGHCANNCDAHDECVGYEVHQYNFQCLYFSTIPMNQAGGPGCYFKHESIIA